jgi:hypothetical protein
VVVKLPNGIDKLKAEVLDMQGKVMFVNENIQVTSGQGELNIQHLSNGLYHINFTSAAYKHAVKIALQK